jgi:hypothetical protein
MKKTKKSDDFKTIDLFTASALIAEKAHHLLIAARAVTKNNPSLSSLR